MSFYDLLKTYNWEEVKARIYAQTESDVKRALKSNNLELDGFISLVSPAAEKYLEQMAQNARSITQQRFGRVISFFTPLYLSNQCTNSCVYCGFNVKNEVARTTLTPDQAESEAKFLHELGFRHILLVSGEAPKTVSLEYLEEIIIRMRKHFASVSVELYPMDTEAYSRLINAGVDGVVVFQETYHEGRYADFHPKGRKSDFRFRLATPERAGQAGIRRIGAGALLGLNDWRVEGFYLAMHGLYLMKRFWKSQLSLSFPRIQPAAGGFQPPSPVTDLHIVQLLTALRALMPDAGMVLSTREKPEFRDNLIPLGITSISAGSSTEPGGYTKPGDAEGQFDVADERSPSEVAEVIHRLGYEPVWKDWDGAFLV